MKVVAVAVVALASVARAQPAYRPVYGSEVATPTSPDAPFVFVAPQLGLGAPLGFLGGEVGVGVAWFRGAVGGGVGLSGGLELGAMGRVVTDVSGYEVGLGLGVSRGPGVPDPQLGWSDSNDPEERTRFAAGTVWGSLEAVVELPVGRYMRTRLFAGVSYALSATCEVTHKNSDEVTPCDPAQVQMREREPWMPYVGVAGVLRFPD